MSDEPEKITWLEWFLLVTGSVVTVGGIAAGYTVGRITVLYPDPKPIVVTNTVTRTVQTPDYFEIGWKDGVFWGALAVARGATNLMDAETRAMAMRFEAVRTRQRHAQQLQSSQSNLVTR